MSMVGGVGRHVSDGGDVMRGAARRGVTPQPHRPVANRPLIYTFKSNDKE